MRAEQSSARLRETRFSWCRIGDLVVTFCLAPNRIALGGLSEHRRASECGSSPCALRIVEDLARYCFTRSTPFYLRVCCGLLPASQVRTHPRPRLCLPLHVSRTADTSPTHQVHGVRRPRHTLPASRLPQGWSRVPAPGRGHRLRVA